MCTHKLLLQLLVQLHANVPSLHVRLWPTRFSDGNIVDGQNLHGFYLFGLASNNPAPASSDEDKQQSRTEKEKVISALMAVLRAFENDIQQNSRYYDPVDAFVSVINIASSQLPSNVVFDTHTWSDNGFDDEIYSDDSDDDDLNDAEVTQDDIPFTSGSLSAPKKKQVKSKTGHLPAPKL